MKKAASYGSGGLYPEQTMWSITLGSDGGRTGPQSYFRPTEMIRNIQLRLGMQISSPDTMRFTEGNPKNYSSRLKLKKYFTPEPAKEKNSATPIPTPVASAPAAESAYTPRYKSKAVIGTGIGAGVLALGAATYYGIKHSKKQESKTGR